MLSISTSADRNDWDGCCLALASAFHRIDRYAELGIATLVGQEVERVLLGGRSNLVLPEPCRASLLDAGDDLRLLRESSFSPDDGIGFSIRLAMAVWEFILAVQVSTWITTDPEDHACWVRDSGDTSVRGFLSAPEADRAAASLWLLAQRLVHGVPVAKDEDGTGGDASDDSVLRVAFAAASET